MIKDAKIESNAVSEARIDWEEMDRAFRESGLYEYAEQMTAVRKARLAQRQRELACLGAVVFVAVMLLVFT